MPVELEDVQLRLLSYPSYDFLIRVSCALRHHMTATHLFPILLGEVFVRFSDLSMPLRFEEATVLDDESVPVLHLHVVPHGHRIGLSDRWHTAILPLSGHN